MKGAQIRRSYHPSLLAGGSPSLTYLGAELVAKNLGKHTRTLSGSAFLENVDVAKLQLAGVTKRRAGILVTLGQGGS